jgi:hypothetical protein
MGNVIGLPAGIDQVGNRSYNNPDPNHRGRKAFLARQKWCRELPREKRPEFALFCRNVL